MVSRRHPVDHWSSKGTSAIQYILETHQNFSNFSNLIDHFSQKINFIFRLKFCFQWCATVGFCSVPTTSVEHHTARHRLCWLRFHHSVLIIRLVRFLSMTSKDASLIFTSFHRQQFSRCIHLASQKHQADANVIEVILTLKIYSEIQFLA